MAAFIKHIQRMRLKKPAAGRAKSPVIQLLEATPEPDDLAKLDEYKGIFPDAETAAAAPMARPSEQSIIKLIRNIRSLKEAYLIRIQIQILSFIIL